MNKIMSALLVVVMIGAVVWSFAFGVPMYMVWQQQKAGEAELARAEQNRQVAVLEAKAKLLEIEDIESSSFKPYLKKDGGFTADFQKLLNNSGLQDAWNEGFSGFYFKKGYLAKNFKNYLSEEYLLYIRINDIRPFMYNDAALMISWNELGTLLLNECNFIKKYPILASSYELINPMKLEFKNSNIVWDCLSFTYDAKQAAITLLITTLN